ncbi:unnamed protein product [Paramecium pentaurelia]|uniref:Transmembrane protein n=1 Tax=Paramecium pentaurelia TaxID=43138 RepID=A0A8S1X5P5_9CILI|nr:unnamed protein product [Paramecium pentaurelia]
MTATLNQIIDIVLQYLNQANFIQKKNTNIINENCSGISTIGKLQFNQRMLYQLSLEKAIKCVRIRITFYLINFQNKSKLKFYAIIKHNLEQQILLIIFEKNETCNGNTNTVLRLQVTFQLFDSNPDLLIKGQFQYQNKSWGFRNVNKYSGYQLYKNKCVQSCSIHSKFCIDYEDIIRCQLQFFYFKIQDIQQLNRYMIKKQIHHLVYQQDSSFLNFSNKIVLSVLLFWDDGSYIETWIIQHPHYAASIYLIYLMLIYVLSCLYLFFGWQRALMACSSKLKF